MLNILLFTINSIMPLILIILFGYFLKIKGFFTAEFLKIGNKTVFYVCLPVLLFKNIADIDNLSEIRLDVIVYVLAIVFVLLVSSIFLENRKILYKLYKKKYSIKCHFYIII